MVIQFGSDVERQSKPAHGFVEGAQVLMGNAKVVVHRGQAGLIVEFAANIDGLVVQADGEAG